MAEAFLAHLLEQPLADDALSAHRQQARTQLAAQTLPERKTESWKYARLAPLYKTRFALVDGGRHCSIAPVMQAQARLVFVDGHLQRDASLLPEGLQVTDTQALADRLQATSAAPSSADWYAHWNSAQAPSPVWIRAQQDVSIEVIAEHSGDGTASHIRLIVDVENGAQVTLVERHEAQTANSLNTALAQIEVAQGAGVVHLRTALPSTTHTQLSSVDVNVQRDARYQLHSFASATCLHRQALRVALSGTGAEADVHGVFLAGGQNQVDTRLEIDHIAAHCNSTEVWRGLAGGRGRASFLGRIHIHQDAQKTSAELSSRNLLLSPTAEINTKPELEIYADDVKCAHGATVGQLDPAQVHYLCARGIGAAQAHSMLAYAFINERVMQLPESLQAQLAPRLRTLFDALQEGV